MIYLHMKDGNEEVIDDVDMMILDDGYLLIISNGGCIRHRKKMENILKMVVK
jgi:hypothetical protein